MKNSGPDTQLLEINPKKLCSWAVEQKKEKKTKMKKKKIIALTAKTSFAGVSSKKSIDNFSIPIARRIRSFCEFPTVCGYADDFKI